MTNRAPHRTAKILPPSTRLGLTAGLTLVLVTAASGGTASAAEPETIDPIDSAPQFWSDVISVGDCIIRPAEGELPAPISCDELHEEEIYAIGYLDFGPDEPYLGDAISDMVSAQLCDQATVEFGGEPWDVLPFQTFLLYPLEPEWEAGDRGIMCSAGPPEGITLKLGTAAGGDLDSDEVLLARGGFSSADLGEFAEWVAVEEHATTASVGTISDGQFELPLRRAWAVPRGFMFNATGRDDDQGSRTWGYTWETGEFADLGSILPGHELASTMVKNGVTIFAARTSADDDWDLYGSTEEGGVYTIADGPGDQQYPALTPGGWQVVFHDDGKLAIVDVDGSNERVLVERGSNAYESSVSPDGSRVAFASDHAGNDDIWLVNIEGGEPVNLTQHPADEAWPVWSADGSRIYFQSNRLRPENRVGSLLMMNPDGSEVSWFSGAALGQPLPLDPAVAAELLVTMPTIDERHSYELVEGDLGTTARWEHTSGRLSADLPAGWLVAELDDGIGFLVAPRPARFNELWEADGLAVNLYDDLASDAFFVLFDETAAAQSCQWSDGTDGIVPVDEVIVGMAAEYDCGEQGAVVTVAALHNGETNVGVIIDGQRDNLPDAESDDETLTEIAQSLVWD